MTAEEYFDKGNRNAQLNWLYDPFLFAEAYHQHKIKSVLEQADEGINELEKVKDKYKTIYTIDVIKLLKRVKEQLLKQ